MSGPTEASLMKGKKLHFTTPSQQQRVVQVENYEEHDQFEFSSNLVGSDQVLNQNVLIFNDKFASEEEEEEDVTENEQRDEKLAFSVKQKQLLEDREM